AHSPWYVIPADDKKNARLLVSQAINETLEALELRYPGLNRARLGELKEARRLLGKERSAPAKRPGPLFRRSFQTGEPGRRSTRRHREHLFHAGVIVIAHAR